MTNQEGRGSSEATPTRLVTFLGRGRRLPDGSFAYDETEYVWGGRCVHTRFVSRALAEMVDGREVLVLATETAQGDHGEALVASLGELGLEPRFHTIGESGDAAELWAQFQVLKEALRGTEHRRVVLDITNGFRSQPFFAAAAVAFVRLVDSQVGDHRVVYGAYAGGSQTPVWDLTPFVDLLDWSRALMLFLRTGRAEDVVEPVRRAGSALAKAWSETRIGSPPRLADLARALEKFGDDLVTMRTGALLLGERDAKGSAARLHDELVGNRESVARTLPPFADVLHRVEAMVRPLLTTALQGAEGERALAALARLYLDMGRYAEAAAVAREAWVTRCGRATAACPGQGGFDSEERTIAEHEWFEREPKIADTVSQVRNDIEHAGFRSSPSRAVRLKASISHLVEGLEATAGAWKPGGFEARAHAPHNRPVFVNISNHASTSWSAEQRDAALRGVAEIVDLPFPAVPPEASPARLEILAKQTLDQVPSATKAVMVVGEYTLTALLVRELQRRGIRCLAATTVREVHEDEEGRKISRFRFVQFRPYPRLVERQAG